MLDDLPDPRANRRMFDRIARRYDRLNAVLSLGLHHRWRRRAVELLATRTGGEYLDVGSGTADVAVEIARRTPGATVTGIDPSEGMLDVGRRHVRSAGLADRIELGPGDATALPFADATFDGAVAAYVLRNIDRRRVAVAEMARVVRPEGRVVIVELTVPVGRVLAALHELYGRTVVPLAGRLLAGDATAYRYLTDSIRRFPPRESIVAMLADAGLADVRAEPLSGGIVTAFVARR